MIRINGFLRVLQAGLFLLPLVVAGAARAADDAPSVRLVALGGDPIDGQLAGLDPTEVTVDTVTGTRTVPLAEVRRLDVRGTRARTLDAVPHLKVVLTGGEVLFGTFAGAIDDGLLLDTPDMGRVPLLLDVVRTLVPVPADADACYEPEYRSPATEDDTVYVQSGDSFSGIVLAVTEEGLELETARGRERRVAWSDLLVLHLQNDVAAPAEGLVVEVETVEGSLLVAAEAPRWKDGALHLSLLSMPERTLEISGFRVRTLRTRGGAFVYASDLPFESEFVEPYSSATTKSAGLARWFEARVDRRPSGCPLRLEGATYRHGFAVHSKSRVTIPLGRRWKRFETVFGVDDQALEVKAGGIVDARLLADGKVLWEAKDVKAGGTPHRVGPLDVSEVDDLVLEVDFGAKLFMRDYATWADPVLHRK